MFLAMHLRLAFGGASFHARHKPGIWWGEFSRQSRCTNLAFGGASFHANLTAQRNDSVEFLDGVAILRLVVATNPQLVISCQRQTTMTSFSLQHLVERAAIETDRLAITVNVIWCICVQLV